MKFKTVKKSSDVILDGVIAELDIVDDYVKGVTLKDTSGHVVRVSERAYNMYVEVPAPPEKEKRFKLSGDVIGLPVEKIFDKEYEAQDEKKRLEDEAASHDLKIEEVEFEIPF